MAGYSRLMGTDEEGALAQLKAVRSDLVDPTFAKDRERRQRCRARRRGFECTSAVTNAATLDPASMKVALDGNRHRCVGSSRPERCEAPA
jgi:hypothetical protein